MKKNYLLYSVVFFILSFLFLPNVSAQINTISGDFPDLPGNYNHFIIINRKNGYGVRLVAWDDSVVYYPDVTNTLFMYSDLSFTSSSCCFNIYDFNGTDWVFYSSTSGGFGYDYIIASNVDIYKIIPGTHSHGVFYEAGYGLVATEPSEFNVNAYSYNYYSNDRLSYNLSFAGVGSETVGSSVSDVLNYYNAWTTSDNKYKLFGISHNIDKSDMLVGSQMNEYLFNYNDDSSDEGNILYFWYIPNFEVNLTINKMQSDDNSYYANLIFSFINNYSDDSLYNFKYYLGDSVSNYNMERIYLDDGPFYPNTYFKILTYNTTLRFQVYDSFDNLIYTNFFTIDENYLLSGLNSYNVYGFNCSNGYDVAFISYLPNSSSIAMNENGSKHISLYYYDLDLNNRVSKIENSYIDSNGFYWYDYDLQNNNYILVAVFDSGIFSCVDPLFYVPNVSYVSFLKDGIDITDPNSTSHTTYKDSEGEIVEFQYNASSENINSKDDTNVSDFFSYFKSLTYNFRDVFQFIGNFLVVLFAEMNPAMTYTISFMFGLVVVAIVIRIWF